MLALHLNEISMKGQNSVLFCSRFTFVGTDKISSQQLQFLTRMHSSRMRTVRLLPVSPPYPGGVPGPGVVYLVARGVPGCVDQCELTISGSSGGSSIVKGGVPGPGGWEGGTCPGGGCTCPGTPPP